MIAVDKDLQSFRELLVNERDCLVDDLLRDVRRIRCINQVQVQAVFPLREEVLGMIFRCSTACVAQKIPMVRLLTGVNDSPAILALDLILVVVLMANV